MVDVTTSIVINRPVNEVATFTANPDNVPHWYVNIKSVQWQTPKPVRVGSRIAFIARFLGKKLAYEYTVNTFRPNEALVMSTNQGPFPMKTEYRWQSAGSGRCEMTLRNVGLPKGFSGWFAPLLERQIRKANEKDLQALKRYLERDD